MNLSELACYNFDSCYNDEETKNCVKFLSNQHQMKRVKIQMDNFAYWEPILMKMKNLVHLDLDLSHSFLLYHDSNEQIIASLRNDREVNTSVKFFKFVAISDLELCQSIINYLSGLIHLNLR